MNLRAKELFVLPNSRLLTRVHRLLLCSESVLPPSWLLHRLTPVLLPSARPHPLAELVTVSPAALPPFAKL